MSARVETTSRDSVAFVSLPAGTAPEGVRATMRNRATGLSATTVLIDGGFDPVMLGAHVGDSIQVAVTDAQNHIVLQLVNVVSSRRPPVVVRTEPPHKKVDVPLNAAIVVVFSEPVNPATVTPASVQLLQSGSPVAGTIRFLDGGRARAALVPNALLATNTPYELVVNRAVRDLSGDPLDAAVDVRFTTGTSVSSGAVASVTVTPDSATLNVSQVINLAVTARDAAGNTLVGPQVTWTNSDSSVARLTVVPSDSLPFITVQALKVGTATITATSEGHSGTLVITVVDLTPIVTQVFVTPESTAVFKGAVLPLTVTIWDQFGHPVTGHAVTWATSDPQIAPVTSSGVVTGVALGSATVTATSEGRSGSAKVLVVSVDTPAVKMAFVRLSGVDDKSRIYLTNADGSQVVYLTAGTALAWSPDVSRIAFSSYSGGNPGISVINVDGTGLALLYNGGGDPSWSPDGSKIAFPGVHVMNADGTGVRELTDNVGSASCPVWSPDGREIAFLGQDLGNDGGVYGTWYIFVVSADGSELVHLANSAGIAGCPQWSPDGSRVLFGASDVIHVINEDGTGLRTLPTGSDARWSPDGTKIVFSQNPDGLNHIWVMNADGTGQTQLTHALSGADVRPAWSPDGLQIAFVSSRGNDSVTIRVMNADGAGDVNFSRGGSDNEPTWRAHRSPIPPRPVAAVTVVTPLDTILPVQTVQLSATPRDAAGIGLRGRTVAWASDNPTVATVSPTGLVTGVDTGTVNITATSEGVTGSATMHVVHVTFATMRAGTDGACAVTPAGGAYCWGGNWRGAVGDGSAVTGIRLVPVPVAGGLTFDSVAYGSCGVTRSGAAYCWGDNELGALGIGSSDFQVHAVPAAVIGGLTFRSVSGGQTYCGLTPTNAAYCWGYDVGGQLGNGASISPEICISGQPCSTQPVAVTGGLSFASVTKSADHACAIATTGGAAYCWGWNLSGQLGTDSTVETCQQPYGGSYPCSPRPITVAGGLTFTALSAGGGYTCGLAGGVAYCWGDNENGQLGVATTTQTCINNTPCSTTPIAVSGSYSFVTISAGDEHACALTVSGTAYCWGFNGSGALGTANTTSSTTPVPVSGGLSFTAISAGANSTCGVTQGQVVYCWGYNGDGQLGNGTTMSSLVPVKVAGQP